MFVLSTYITVLTFAFILQKVSKFMPPRHLLFHEDHSMGDEKTYSDVERGVPAPADLGQGKVL